MARHSDAIRLLLANGPMAVRQLVEKTGLSQPTLSRALVAMATEVIRIGAGPSTRYALQDTTHGFTAPHLFRVTESGVIQTLGRLTPVRPAGFVLATPEGATLHSDGLPWWLFDLRPQGYLGRAYALTHAATLGLPPNPEHWSDSDVLRALVAQGHDAVGNLLIGELARDRFVDAQLPTPVDRAVDYPALAANASAGEVRGSTAGGEQPKFCAYTERGHVLVKFTVPDDNPISERWRDLLLTEHLALSVLGVETKVFDFAGQRFLEVPRFDRIGQLGRLGVFSLRALDAEFVGDASAPWPMLVRRLVAEGHVDAAAVQGTALLWAFGMLIGNTDMHAGNLSFVSGHGRPYHLAPAYDMLPMGFAPRSGGVMRDTLLSAGLASSVDGKTWREALGLAELFFAQVSDSKGLSARFAPCVAELRRHLDDATARIARLG